jgi:hypothetical protein
VFDHGKFRQSLGGEPFSRRTGDPHDEPRASRPSGFPSAPGPYPVQLIENAKTS